MIKETTATKGTGKGAATKGATTKGGTKGGAKGGTKGGTKGRRMAAGPGRPEGSGKGRTEVSRLRLTADELDALRYLAEEEGLPLATYMRERLAGPDTRSFVLRIWRTEPGREAEEVAPSDYLVGLPTMLTEHRESSGAKVQVMIGSTAQQLAGLYRDELKRRQEEKR